MKDGTYHCPVEVAMELVGGKWTPVILAHLKQGPRRFSEMRRLIPDVSEKMLTQRLRKLEADGLVLRTVISNSPPHVSYDLTEAGHSLGPALQALFDWGQGWADTHNITIEAPAG